MNLLELANPIASWAALLAVPIIALYILKLRLRRETVSTFLFWSQLFDENKPRAWWQRLRHWLSLLLQLAFLALLVAALVDPLWSWQREQQRRIVLIMDNSASMQAVEPDGQTRLELARQTAAKLIRSLRAGDRMAILSAGGKPTVVLGMTNHQRSLLGAIDGLSPTDGPTEIVGAVELAQRLLEEGEEQLREIVVLTDGCFDEAAELSSREDVQLVGVGSHQENLGITQFQVRRNLLDATTYQVLLDVGNFTDSPQSCRVELTLEDELADVIPLELEPNQTITRIVDHTAIAGGRLVARLDSDDALAVDNSAIAVLPKLQKLPVTLVSDGNLFIESVFRSMPLIELKVVSEPPKLVAAAGIIVFEKTVPPTLPAGRTIVIDPQNDCDLWKLGAAIDQPLVAWTSADSAITKHVRLDNVLLPKSRLLEFAGAVEALLKGPDDQPLLARLRRPAGDVVVLTGSLDEGDLPLRIAFPVLMKNTVEWFQGNSGQLLPTVATGELVTIRTTAAVQLAAANPPAAAPSSAATEKNTESTDGELAVVERTATRQRTDWQLISPSRQHIPIAITADRATIGPLLEAGVWLAQPVTAVVSMETEQRDANLEPLSAQTFVDARNVPVACNVASPAESDLRPRANLDQLASVQKLALAGHSLWVYLTMLALGLITAEWWLYQRRIVG